MSAGLGLAVLLIVGIGWYFSRPSTESKKDAQNPVASSVADNSFETIQLTDTTSTGTFSKKVTETYNPLPIEAIAPPPIRCKVGECKFRETCVQKPTNSHCEQNDSTKGWKCDDGYVLHNTLCKGMDGMGATCKIERGDGSYFTGKITSNNLIVCSCKKGYHFANSQDYQASAWCVQDYDFGGLSPDATCGALTLLRRAEDPPLHVSFSWCPPDYGFYRQPIKWTVPNTAN
ncbi:hypothetical protein KBD61_04960 [Patescibacteria group bacterium]|nr:hypothetical protein [Patescibacteria group bacterium]MBP9710340.1 hypothetical protein [Patescibacteria group bacterium]